MPVQDTSKIKEKIISVLRLKGPSLPVHVSREIESSILFTSAFLSELISEKRIRISNMRVGSSPLYLIQGHEPMLERFAHHLKSKEKEAFSLLREKKFLKDSEQQPAIRVALREIRDFAVPFHHNENLFWRYFTVNESEFSVKKQAVSLVPVQEKKEIRPEIVSEKPLNIFDRSEEKSKKARKSKKKTKERIRRSSKENFFFKKLKESLAGKGIEIIDVKSFSKNEIMLKARESGNEKIIFAFNKKRVTDKDIVRAAKKSHEYSLPYKILSLAEPAKKVQDLIESVKNLSSIEKI